MLADDLVVLIMGSDPDPQDAIFDLSTEGSIMCAHPNSPERAEPPEVKGRVLRIALEEQIALICQSAYLLGEGTVKCPEARGAR